MCSYKELISCCIPQILREAKEEIELPIMMEELYDAVRKGKRNKAIGADGMSLILQKKSGIASRMNYLTL